MTFFQRIASALQERARSSQTVGPLLFAVVVGAGAGGAAYLFRELIELMGRLFFGELGGPLEAVLGAPYTIVVLALGGLLVGLITRYFASEARGHGVPEVMLAVAYRGGRIRPRVTVVKALTAAITIGSGGSAGREGPITQIGAALGSTVAQLFRLPDRQVTLSVACGAAGGIAATFNAPIAGVMFALEVILARFTSLTFGLVVISSATATIVARALLGNEPAFPIPHEYALVSISEVLLYAGLGLVCALVSQVYIRAIYGIEVLAEKVTMPDFLKPAAGGAVVGLIGIGLPQIFGNGYPVMVDALAGRVPDDLFLVDGPGRFVLPLLLLGFAKIGATALTVGSGGSGGVFAPSLFTGAMFGGAFGFLVNGLFPGSVAGPGAYALVGMAAVFAGSSHAPITAVFMLFEMTDDYHIILPLMTATVISVFVSQHISRDSVYTIKLRRRGITIGGAQDINLMDAITVREAMSEKFESVPPDMPLTALVMKFATGHYAGYPVVEKDGTLAGIVTAQDVENAIVDRNPDDLRVRDICTRNVIVARPDQSLSHALTQFGSRNIGRLPVVDPDDPTRIIGMLTRTDVVAAYADAYSRGTSLVRRLDEMRALSESSDTVITEETLTAGGELAGKLVRDAGFPSQSTLVKIRRADMNIIPSGSTELQPGDTLVVLCTRRTARQVGKWLREKC